MRFFTNAAPGGGISAKWDESSLFRCSMVKKHKNISLIMVENSREYVLQWPGHAAYVTERFSGLLARQTLVDVTLICDEQKLRVHKLVLASCSLYFEEILAEDLGPEPIILLRDLNFSVLKAMIEFMYCGETTVSHVHLPSLLSAARLFKVKELESLVEKMIGSITQDHNDNTGEYLPKDIGSSGRVNGVIKNENDGIRASFTNKNNGKSTHSDTESSDSESERNYVEENISGTLSDSLNDRCLYEDPCGITKSKIMYSSLLRKSEVSDSLTKKNDSNNLVESLSDSSSTFDSENCEKDSQPTRLFERCCEFVNNGCSKKNEESSQMYLTPDSTDNEINRVGQCSKVYTHKKRKINGDSTLKRYPHFEKILPQPLASNRIDLSNDLSNDEAPVTLKTNLDTESSDYLLSFNSESIQSIVGCSLSDFCPSGPFELLNTRTHSDDKDSVEEEDRPPVLRRSVRLNQQDSEESFPSRAKSKLRDRKASRSASNIKLLSRTKRKNRESERRVPNVKLIVTAQSTRKNHSRPLRRTSKLVGRCPTKNDSAKSNDASKTVEKVTNTVVVHEKPETIAGDNQQSSENSVKLSIRASSLNRALWGDMSDLIENGELDDEYFEYSTSAEIPFAVGLLPLREALEKVQATLDHQPRKTRSSASTKQETSNLKRKGSPTLHHHREVAVSAKKSSNENCVKSNTRASSANRALWGDMSDVAEDSEFHDEYLEYTPSAKIPFAVGLLPLREALERMQATLDHQPRKTRSSVASTKQETNNLKRKSSPSLQHQQEVIIPAKKQNINGNEVVENASAVYHVQIRTSPPCSKPRKRSLSDGATTSLGETAVNGMP